MAKFTTVICCADAADTLDAACRSVAWADELIVVDSGSTDATGEIARRYADRYIQEPWRGYRGQKQFGASLAKHDWVLILDGDEECSPALAEEIRNLGDAALEACDVMYMPRRNYIMGRPVRGWWPDWQSRLIQRHRVDWPDESLHEGRAPSDPRRTARLKHPIEHKRTSTAGFGDYFSGRRMDERLLMVARQMHQQGRRARWWNLTLRPRLAFLKFYILKRGFLDGTFGLLIAQKAAVSTQLKYAALWAVQQGAERTGAKGPSENPSPRPQASSPHPDP